MGAEGATIKAGELTHFVTLSIVNFNSSQYFHDFHEVRIHHYE